MDIAQIIQNAPLKAKSCQRNSLIGGGAGQAEGQLEGFPGQCIVSQNCRNPGMRWARY